MAFFAKWVDKGKSFEFPVNSYSWYRDLRRYGTLPDAGFGPEHAVSPRSS